MGGFVPVGTFASLMGLATVLHWEKFDHDHVALWLWAGLCFTTPFLVLAVYLANRRYDAPVTSNDELLTPLTTRVMGAIFALGIAAIGVVFERRWSAVRLMAQVAAVMLVLVVIAVIRGGRDIDGSAVLTWQFAVGFVAMLTVCAWLLRRAAGAAAAVR